MDSFTESYAEARGKFLAAALDAGARLHSYGRDDLKGSAGEPLACDVAILGPENAARAALAITGTHGIEGFTGSAVLHRWLTSRRSAQHNDVKIVLVHAINPWAFSHKTRTTENDVDLNRNFIRDNVGYQRENPAYDALAPFLHIDPSDARHSLAAYRAYKSYLDQHGWHLENEMLEGQYHHPDGLFYAGKEPEWSNRLFRRILAEHLAQASTVGFVDWHTGVGSFGEVVYLITGDKGSADYSAAARWWNREGDETSAFKSERRPNIAGCCRRPSARSCQMRRWPAAWSSSEPRTNIRSCAAIASTAGSGSRDQRSERRAFQDAYKDIMCPPDLSWRRMVLDEGPAIMDKLIAGVAGW